MDNFEEYYKIGDLISKYLRGTLSASERDELFVWRKQSTDNERLFNRFLSDQTLVEGLQEFDSVSRRDEIWQKIVRESAPKSLRETYSYSRYIRYAAAVVVTLGLGYIFRFSEIKDSGQGAIVAGEFLPGGNRAVLVLDGGQKIDLDKAHTGEIARQGDAVISKSTDGYISYVLSGVNNLDGDEKVIFNTITTPKGGQYRLQLPDGSKVWLNAESSLRFPTRFQGDLRQVDLTGEAFFEVVHLEKGKVPFKVLSGKQEIEVLGTEFNVNSYSDEQSITTTLVNGTVRVKNLDASEGAGSLSKEVILKPGQQASVQRNSEQIQVSSADLETITAWKDGQFWFNDTELETIMRQISRWYDVEVEWVGDVKGLRFRGRISRGVPASRVFKILEASGINIKTDGKKVTVSS